jgi:S-adenosylmethionine/arginine decarboxylase-like enzyme
MASRLGNTSYLSAFSIKGSVEVDQCKRITQDIINSIGMKPIFSPAHWKYLEKDVGYIYVQPIYESYIAWDVWPKWGGAYLAVCSCKKFKRENVIAVIQGHSLKISGNKNMEMGLNKNG